MLNVQGIDSHQIVDIPIFTAGAVIPTQRDEVISIFHQYAYTGKSKSIHSSLQFEWFKHDLNDKSIKVSGGLQRIQTVDVYIIPLNIKSDLAYLTMQPYTDKEWDTLPHVIMTADDDWYPSVLDHAIDDDDQWFDAVSYILDNPTTRLFDEFGDYRATTIVNSFTLDKQSLEDKIITTDTILYQVQAQVIKAREPDYKA